MSQSPSFAETPTLVGDRVMLRPMGPGDAGPLFDFVNEAEARRLTGTHTVFTREQIDRHCATRGDHVDRLDYAVVDTASGRLVGELAVTELDTDNRSCSFRIGLAEAATGRGIGTEATELVVAHLFRVGIHRVSLEVYDFNPRARHVYEKVGFVHEGTLRDALRWDGGWVDAHVMSILAPD